MMKQAQIMVTVLFGFLDGSVQEIRRRRGHWDACLLSDVKRTTFLPEKGTKINLQDNFIHLTKPCYKFIYSRHEEKRKA